MRRFLQAISQSVLALFPTPRRLALAAAVLLALCILTFLTSHPAGFRGRPHVEHFQTANAPASLAVESEAPTDATENDNSGVAMQALAPADKLKSSRAFSPFSNAEPRIAYSADLSVITKDFIHARASMEDILDRHRGYAARLRMIGNPTGNSLSATIKVPASEYSSALSDLKLIGDVQTDDESADEVVQQHGDLEARLQNARNNVRRLEQLLKENSEKSIDVSYVQGQLVILRAEIAKLELERHNVDSRVVFSNIHFSLREVRETPAETISAQLRHAAASGLTDVIGSLSAIVILLVGYGPSFLLWAAILFFPARYLWRRTQTPVAHETA